MNSKHVKGLQVISIADGKRLGKIEHVYLDSAARRVVGFGIVEHGGLFSAKPEETMLVDTNEVHSLGPDAMTLETSTPAQGEHTTSHYGDLLPLDRLASRRVVTEGGTAVGGVASIDFDERSYEVTAVEVSAGFFKSSRSVSAEHLISIGEDVLVVADAVCAPDEADAGEAYEPYAPYEEDTASAADDSRAAESRLVVGDTEPLDTPMVADEPVAAEAAGPVTRTTGETESSGSRLVVGDVEPLTQRPVGRPVTGSSTGSSS